MNNEKVKSNRVPPCGWLFCPLFLAVKTQTVIEGNCEEYLILFSSYIYIYNNNIYLFVQYVSKQLFSEYLSLKM